MSRVKGTYGYSPGLLSNSMLQAAVVCPVKYQMLYLDRVDLKKDGVWFDDTWPGTMVHDCIERHDNDVPALWLRLYEQVEEVFGPVIASKSRGLIDHYRSARERTLDEGKKYGREYKAPEMTGYWAKNYAGLDRLFEKLEEQAQTHIPNSKFEVPFVTLIKKAVVSLENWPKLRVDAPVAVEVQYQYEVGPDDARTKMVGTIDRLERRSSGIAICDYKTGKWGYSRSSLANSDQFGLYDLFVERSGEPVVEWTVYDLFLGRRVSVTPSRGIREAFQSRLANNLRYYTQIKGVGAVVPTPAGSNFKTGCPCIVATAGLCPYVVEVPDEE